MRSIYKNINALFLNMISLCDTQDIESLTNVAPAILNLVAGVDEQQNGLKLVYMYLATTLHVSYRRLNTCINKLSHSILRRDYNFGLRNYVYMIGSLQIEDRAIRCMRGMTIVHFTIDTCTPLMLITLRVIDRSTVDGDHEWTTPPVIQTQEYPIA